MKLGLKIVNLGHQRHLPVIVVDFALIEDKVTNG